ALPMRFPRSAGATLLAFLLLAGSGDGATVINLSTRAPTSPGANTLAVGFTVAGAGTKPFLIRGIGPALTGFGVPGALAKPVLTLFDSHSAPIATNAGWGGAAALSAAFAQTGAFALAAGSADAALLSGLTPDGYSAQISDAGNGSGIALAEVYDTAPGTASSRLVNLSARALAGSGPNALAAGFVIAGSGNEELVIRGIGPTLGVFGIAGSLASPVLTIYDASGHALASNSGWGGSAALTAAFTQVGAFPLAANSADSALLVTLPAGAYTAQVTGAGTSTGVALVEVYEVSPPLPLQTQIANFLAANQGNPGPLVCTLAAGTYNSSSTSIALANASFPKGLTIDGTGVHIVMTQFNSAVTLTRCTGITVANLT